MLLTLYRGGYDVGRYISLEHEIERTKETYYEALAASSAGWREGENDYLPYVTCFLGVVLACYRELDERMAMLSQGSSEERVRAFLAGRLEPVSRREIADALPAISSRTLDRVLSRLQAAGELEKVGAARATRYRWVRPLHATPLSGLPPRQGAGRMTSRRNVPPAASAEKDPS